jgi:hypothetical protein
MHLTSLALSLLSAPLLHAASPACDTDIYQRAALQFAAANFFKPTETKSEDMMFKLAPLLMLEAATGGTNPTPGHDPRESQLGKPGDPFGALTLSNGSLTIDTSHPAVYTQLGTVSIRGKPHIQTTYFWFYSAAPPAPANPALACQGVRLTLNSRGGPVIWEVLADPSGATVIFVSESLEAAARTKFGLSLPGRRYSVERSLEDAPRVVVARVIDDAPVPMGPFVYLSAGTRCVSTVLCRCMSPQVKSLLSTRTYDLVPGKDAPIGSFITTTNASNPTAFWPGDPIPRARLEDSLRLPDEF